jgi:hypothetical protein
MWSISQDNRVIDITNVRIETFVPLKMSDPPVIILVLEKKKGRSENDIRKISPNLPNLRTCRP